MGPTCDVLLDPFSDLVVKRGGPQCPEEIQRLEREAVDQFRDVLRTQSIVLVPEIRKQVLFVISGIAVLPSASDGLQRLGNV